MVKRITVTVKDAPHSKEKANKLLPKQMKFSCNAADTVQLLRGSVAGYVGVPSSSLHLETKSGPVPDLSMTLETLFSQEEKVLYVSLAQQTNLRRVAAWRVQGDTKTKTNVTKITRTSARKGITITSGGEVKPAQPVNPKPAEHDKQKVTTFKHSVEPKDRDSTAHSKKEKKKAKSLLDHPSKETQEHVHDSAAKTHPVFATPIVDTVSTVHKDIAKQESGNCRGIDPSRQTLVPPSVTVAHQVVSTPVLSMPQYTPTALVAPILNRPKLVLPNGDVEEQDIGTTLGDLVRSFGDNIHLVELLESSPPVVHRASNFVLESDITYQLEFTLRNEYESRLVQLQVEIAQMHNEVTTVQETLLNSQVQLEKFMNNVSFFVEEQKEIITKLTQQPQQAQPTPSPKVERKKAETGKPESVGTKLVVTSPSGQVRPPDASVVREDSGEIDKDHCYSCGMKFTLLHRRHKCKICLKPFCSSCNYLRASLPVGYGLHRPARVCVNCFPTLFSQRHNLSATSIASLHQFQSKISIPNISLVKDSAKSLVLELFEKENHSEDTVVVDDQDFNSVDSLMLEVAKKDSSKSHPSLFVDGTFYTSGDYKVAVPLRFLEPVCRVAFYWSGVGDSSKFDRSAMDKATQVKYMPQYFYDKKFYANLPYTWPQLYPYDRCAKGEVAPIDCDKVHKMCMYVFYPKRGTAPYPVLLFYHGGGFCLGHADDQLYIAVCSELASLAECIVISVEYRLAPEFKFPTQLEDAYSALEWVYDNGKEILKADVHRIAVAGDSAGGSLACAVSIMSRDRKGPKICHQVLIYPALTRPYTDTLDSHKQYENGPILTRSILKFFFSQLFEEGNDAYAQHPYSCPLGLPDCSDLPAATIVNAMHDPLRDHGFLYAMKLREFKVPVTRTVYTKSVHAFFGTNVGESDEALAECATALRKAFASPRLSSLSTP